jgi:hypothetical protein
MRVVGALVLTHLVRAPIKTETNIFRPIKCACLHTFSRFLNYAEMFRSFVSRYPCIRNTASVLSGSFLGIDSPEKTPMQNLLRLASLFFGLVLFACSAIRATGQTAKSEPSPFSSRATPGYTEPHLSRWAQSRQQKQSSQDLF